MSGTDACRLARLVARGKAEIAVWWNVWRGRWLAVRFGSAERLLWGEDGITVIVQSDARQ